MKNLSNIIENYLSGPTDYAVQIVGNFGRGKTHHYRNVLEDQIARRPTYGNEKKTYKPIYISLFGLKSTEEVAAKIVLSFYQYSFFKGYFKRKGLRKRLNFTVSILKIGIRGFLGYYKLGNLNDYLSDVRQAGKDVLETAELLVCFDDLERKDDELTMHDLAGYVNVLVDEGVKVLIIANDDLLLRNGGDYRELKEKIIGVSVEFVPERESTIKDIIEKRYVGSSLYQKYLLGRLPMIDSFAKSVQENFRHVVYALDRLRPCFAMIRAEIFDPKLEISEKVREQFDNIVRLILAFAAEYKGSEVKHSDKQAFEHRASLSFKVLNSTRGEKEPREKSRLELFLEKYEIAPADYYFYDSLYTYLTGHGEFDCQQFIGEFIHNFNLEKGKILPQYELYQSLGYNNCFSLSDDEYRRRTMEMIDYARRGLYAAADYLSVMHYCERFDNVLNLDLSDVLVHMTDGVKLSISSSFLNWELSFGQFEMSGKAGELSRWNQQLYEAGMNEIKLHKEKLKRERLLDLSMKLIDHFEEFAERYELDRQFRGQVSMEPFLGQIGSKGLMDFIEKANHQRINFLRYFFSQRFQDLDILTKEWNTLNELVALLGDYHQRELDEVGKTIRNYLLGDLLRSLTEVTVKHASVVASA